MKKIIIEINGVKHQLKADTSNNVYCDTCSLNSIYKIHENICLCNLFSHDTHFEIIK